MTDAWIGWDWGLTTLATGLLLLLFFFDRTVPAHNIPRAFSTLVFLVYFANHLYVGYFHELFDSTAAAWGVAVLIIGILLLLAYVWSAEFVGFGIFFFMASHGLTWYYSIGISIFFGFLVWGFIVWRKAGDLVILLVDSLVIAAGSGAGTKKYHLEMVCFF